MSNDTQHNIREIKRLLARPLVIAAATAAIGAGSMVRPASATTSTQWGSGWLTRSASGAVSSWVSTGAKAKLLDVGGGEWKVTFPGISGGFGVPAVTPRNDLPGGSCSIVSWNAFSGDASVTFQCMRRDGTLAKSGFSVSYTSNPGALEGWAYAQLPDYIGSYASTAFYDSNGGTVNVAHSVTGIYLVAFPGIGILPSDGTYTVNAVGWSGAHCNVIGTNRFPADLEVSVRCGLPDGTPANAPFVVHAVGRRALLGTAAPKAAWGSDRSPGVYGTSTISSPDSFTSNGKAVTVTHTKVGVFTFKFPGLSSDSTRMVHATSRYVVDDERCTANGSNSGTTAVVTVNCRDDLGHLQDVPVDVQYEGV